MELYRIEMNKIEKSYINSNKVYLRGWIEMFSESPAV